jgi:hypothetical protein
MPSERAVQVPSQIELSADLVIGPTAGELAIIGEQLQEAIAEPPGSAGIDAVEVEISGLDEASITGEDDGNNAYTDGYTYKEQYS